MGKPQLPKDFDWVTARRECSAAKVFESLLAAARKNVDAMQQTADGRTWNPIELKTFGDSFSIVREGFNTTGVRFYVEQQSRIVAEFWGLKRGELKAELTVNDDGECRLLVEGKELQEWQFLKRVLEPLFFYRQD